MSRAQGGSGLVGLAVLGVAGWVWESPQCGLVAYLMKGPLSGRTSRGGAPHPESPTGVEPEEATSWDSCLGFLRYHRLWESHFTAKPAVQEAIVGSSAAEALRRGDPELPHFLGKGCGASYPCL